MGIRKTTGQFIEECKLVHGSRYNYSKVEYVNNASKVQIGCKIHGDFWQKPTDHIKGSDCPDCAKVKFSSSYIANRIARKFKGVVQPEKYKLIPLTKGKFAKVDNDDFDKVSQINWNFNGAYCENGKLGLMHRYLTNCPKDKFVDHINHDKLDNRKCNLRVCTKAENAMNSRPKKGFTSKYKGVNWCKRDKAWISGITFNYKRIHLGYFKTEEEAGLAYNEKAKELFGEFAKLNKI